MDDRNTELVDLAEGLALDYDRIVSSSTADLSFLNSLASIDKTIADTAVALYIYDTRNDSDGGAWRFRCDDTSWYNEDLITSTRGARREFPQVAIIFVKTNLIAIYDGDDPTLPFWMAFNIAVSHNIFIGSTLGNPVVAMNKDILSFYCQYNNHSHS